jgi:hypothetical protein
MGKMKKSRAPTAPGKPGYLMYEDIPRYDWWVKLILGSVLAATLIAGIVLVFNDIADALVMFGLTAFDALTIYLVMPKRYQLFDNKVRIVLGGPFGMDIPLSNIKEVRPASGSKTSAFWGIQLATSSRTAMEIIRKKGWSVLISPSDREAFLERLNEALKAARGSP